MHSPVVNLVGSCNIAAECGTISGSTPNADWRLDISL